MDARTLPGILAIGAALALWMAVVFGVAVPLGSWLLNGGIAPAAPPSTRALLAEPGSPPMSTESTPPFTTARARR